MARDAGAVTGGATTFSITEFIIAALIIMTLSIKRLSFVVHEDIQHNYSVQQKNNVLFGVEIRPIMQSAIMLSVVALNVAAPQPQ
jgi:hypothetical protein